MPLLLSCIAGDFYSPPFSKIIPSPIVITTLKILSQFRKRFYLTAASSLTPVHNSHLFLPPRLDHTFDVCLKNGITNIGQLYIGGVFGSSGDVIVKYNIPQNHLLSYFQLRNLPNL